MATVSWVIEKFRNHEEESERLAAAVRASGHPVYEYYPYRGLTRQTLEILANTPVMFHGSCLGAVMFGNEAHRTYPGAFLQWENYQCSVYYKYWGDLCLNAPTAQHFILAEVSDLADELFVTPKFVRPDKGSKTFAGEIFETAEDIKRGFLDILRYTAEDTRLVLAEPQTLGREWRVFYNAAGMLPGIICGSQYRNNGRLAVEPGLPDHVSRWVDAHFADQEWYPDPLVVLDIVEVMPDRTLKLLEIGAVNVAGLYAAELEPFVKTESDWADRQYRFGKNCKKL